MSYTTLAGFLLQSTRDKTVNRTIKGIAMFVVPCIHMYTYSSIMSDVSFWCTMNESLLTHPYHTVQLDFTQEKVHRIECWSCHIGLPPKLIFLKKKSKKEENSVFSIKLCS